MLTSRPLLVFALLSLSLAAVATATSLLIGGGSTTQAAPATTTITVGDTWFCTPAFQGGVCTTVISAGDTVSWDFSGAAATHSTTECGASCDSPSMTPLWDSGLVSNGQPFQFTFNQAGTFLYHCRVHPSLMHGAVTVQGEPNPTATQAPPPPTRPGDVDCSGGVSAIDAALVLQFDARLLQSLRCPQNGDTNRDGRTNSLDAALILQRVAGLIGTLPPA